ncbi:hypothetical protein F5984_00790 [Rudanella paleaurantiibacter]|jgi:hypothetical protein|uniref:Uncharacterized protein n=2 Tax=Cytophagaceae TaxID=89373 RepID=A0A7J5U604_9BACT|nr:hypothetical protein F5984_00790 [Rudanella paleaurantiibacter]
MTLTGPTGSFELAVLDYEYSDSPRFLERNGLLVHIRTRHQNHEWSQAVPVLSTWELELLRDWMSSVAAHQHQSRRITFVEPEISFSDFSGGTDGYDLRLKLSHEAQPGWQPTDQQAFYLTLSPDSTQLQEAIVTLDEQLQQFPVRD